MPKPRRAGTRSKVDDRQPARSLQDRNERDFDRPIVSVSLGLPAIFLWGGKKRTDKVRRVPLAHGDVVVWGGPDRLTFHGVRSLADGEHSLTGAYRFNFTFRRAQ